MADAKTTALTAATSWATGDLLYMVSDPAGTPASRKITLDNIFAKVPSALPFGYADAPITRIAASDIRLPDATRGTLFYVGSVAANGANIAATGGSNNTLILSSSTAGTTGQLAVTSLGAFVGSTAGIGFTSNQAVNTPDTIIRRDGAANTLALRNDANAQTFNLYGTYIDASNYRRLAVSSTTAGVFSLSATGAGTGSAGNVLHISSLPTSNPGAGILWNNAGTPAIGT